MDTFFLVILGFLALLAAIDLFVGVSNDASNFLNSAVGCRIAPYKVLVAVAGLGILLGATFSGGMMEIAKKGVFNPGMFSFSDVMAIYFSVMVTDVVLLNFFNSMGLPTCTYILERMKQVISGEHGGISKKVQWTGGGEFYFVEYDN